MITEIPKPLREDAFLRSDFQHLTVSSLGRFTPSKYLFAAVYQIKCVCNLPRLYLSDESTWQNSLAGAVHDEYIHEYFTCLCCIILDGGSSQAGKSKLFDSIATQSLSPPTQITFLLIMI